MLQIKLVVTDELEGLSQIVATKLSPTLFVSHRSDISLMDCGNACSTAGL